MGGGWCRVGYRVITHVCGVGDSVGHEPGGVGTDWAGGAGGHLATRNSKTSVQLPLPRVTRAHNTRTRTGRGGGARQSGGTKENVKTAFAHPRTHTHARARTPTHDVVSVKGWGALPRKDKHDACREDLGRGVLRGWARELNPMSGLWKVRSGGVGKGYWGGGGKRRRYEASACIYI